MAPPVSLPFSLEESLRHSTGQSIRRFPGEMRFGIAFQFEGQSAPKKTVKIFRFYPYNSHNQLPARCLRMSTDNASNKSVTDP
jgi:hypothetical protein